VQRARVIDERIDATEFGDGPAKRFDHVGLDRNVSLNGDRSRSQPNAVRHHRVGRRGILDECDRNVVAARGGQRGRGRPDSTASSGDQHDLALIAHGMILTTSSRSIRSRAGTVRKMSQAVTIRIEPASDAIGARVTGIDLSQPLDSEQFEVLHQAILDHQVLVLPDQEMGEDDHVRFTEMWGSMPVRDRYKNRNEKQSGNEKIMLVTNVRENGKPIGSLPDGEVMFHSDGAYDERPYKYTLLFGIDIPSAGGNTLFANMYLAYETLPDDLKTKLATFHGRNLYYSGTMRKHEQIGEYSGCTDHPLFVKHDETGRTSIYVSRTRANRFWRCCSSTANETNSSTNITGTKATSSCGTTGV
jgi:taurine dioxygenase